MGNWGNSIFSKKSSPDSRNFVSLRGKETPVVHFDKLSDYGASKIMENFKICIMAIIQITLQKGILKWQKDKKFFWVSQIRKKTIFH